MKFGTTVVTTANQALPCEYSIEYWTKLLRATASDFVWVPTHPGQVASAADGCLVRLDQIVTISPRVVED